MPPRRVAAAAVAVCRAIKTAHLGQFQCSRTIQLGMVRTLRYAHSLGWEGRPYRVGPPNWTDAWNARGGQEVPFERSGIALFEKTKNKLISLRTKTKFSI